MDNSEQNSTQPKNETAQPQRGRQFAIFAAWLSACSMGFYICVVLLITASVDLENVADPAKPMHIAAFSGTLTIAIFGFGLGFGCYALSATRRHGRNKIRMPALVGVVTNGIMLPIFIAGWTLVVFKVREVREMENKELTTPAPGILWSLATPTNGWFSVSMPHRRLMRPKETVEIRERAGSKAETRGFTSSVGTAGFFASYTEVDTAVSFETNIFFETARKLALGPDGILIEEHSTNYGAYTCRELSGKRNQGRIFVSARTFVVPPRIFSTIAMAPVTNIPNQVIQQFHDSFKIEDGR